MFVEITPSEVLEWREGRAASEARCPGCGLSVDIVSLRIWNETPPFPHVPDSIWHRILAVTLSVYWLGYTGAADQPLGLREALSCFPTPFPSSPHCGSFGTWMDTHTPGNREVGS